MGTEKITETLEEPTSRLYGDAPTTSLTVTVIGGSVDVVATDDAGPATVDVHEISGPPLTVTWEAGALKVEQLKDSAGQMWGALGSLLSPANSPGRPSVRLTVRVPDEAKVSVRSASADVLAGGSHGPVTIYTASGGVTLDHPTGSVDVTTASGSVDCASPAGELTVKTATGAITVQDAVLRTARVNTVSGETVLDLRHGPSIVTANTVSGNVTVRVPQTTGYDVTAATVSGGVIVDGETVMDEGKRGGHRHTGDRSVAVKSRTVSGTLVLLRGGAAPGSAGPVIGEDLGDIQDDVPRREAGEGI
ncbi:MAG: DUF4097 family beta strand repeat-containing protein [Mobilicoccus sp.]|nr:DUF4097 family beta strand repeat-containing protein [Mobilicoccus sp.]